LFLWGVFMKTIIYLVRHGESIGNKKRLCLGHTDLNLSELGLIQAEKTAEKLSDIEFSKVYSSDLLRAYNTALPHAKKRGLEVIKKEGLREIYLGEWENVSFDVLMTEHKEVFEKEWKAKFGVFQSPGGESVPVVAERVYNTVLAIAKENLGSTVLCASHAAAIRALWGRISNINPEDLAPLLPFPSNASYSIIEFDGEVLKPIKYSSDEHLSEICTRLSI